MLLLLGPLAVAAATSLVPGALLGRVLGLPWRWAAVVAPALSAAVLGGWAALGGQVTGAGAAAATVAALVLAAALTRGAALRRSEPPPVPRGRDRPRPSSRRRTGLLLAAGGAVVGAGALSAVVALAGARPGVVNQLWDAAWHANLTRLIADSGDGRPSVAGALIGAGWRDVTSWYPSGLHVQAALVERATGAGVSVSLQAAVAVAVVMVLPLVLAALTWALAAELVGRDGQRLDHRARGVGAGVAALVGVLPTAFPLDRVWRPAWPMTVSFVLALVAVLALVVCVRAARRRVMTRTGAAAVPLLAVAGAGLVHPSGAVLAVLVSTAWVTGRALAGTGRARTRALLAVAGPVALAAGATVLAREHVGAVASVFAYDYRLGEGLAPALAAVAGLSAPVVPGTGYGVTSDAGQPLAGALLAAGALGCALTRGARWIAGLWLVLVLAALETFTPVAAPLTLITGWFFNVESRLVALVALVGALGVGLAVASGASRLLAHTAAGPARSAPAVSSSSVAALRTGGWPVRVITLPDTGAAPALAPGAATERELAGVAVGCGSATGQASAGPGAAAAINVRATSGLQVVPEVVLRAGAGPTPPVTAGSPTLLEGRSSTDAVDRDRRLGAGRTRPGGSLGTRRHLLLGACAASLAAVVLAVGFSSVERAGPRVRAAWTERVVGADARTVMGALSEQPLPPGGRILNDPLDGSPWLYALTGTMPMFTHYDDREPDGDALTLLEGLDRADTDPSVRAALEALSVCYVYDAPTLVSAKEEPHGGFAGLSGVDALEPVVRSGPVVAYAVVPPPPGCAPH